MVDDFSSLLTIEVIDHGEQDRQRDGPRCSVCLQSSSAVTYTLPRCRHGVCHSCLDLVKSRDTSVFCVICQIRSVSPNPDQGETSSESWLSSPTMVSSSTSSSTSSSMSSEKHEIIKTQLTKLYHLDDAVYKPIAKHFERILLMIKKGLDKKVQLIETHFEEIVDALDKRKKKIIRSLKQNTKANKAMIEIKKKAMEKERTQLKECRKRHQDKVRDRGNGKTSDIMINSFLAEVDDIQRKARKTSTENSITELDELEVVTDSEVEGTIKDAVEKLATLRETAKLLKSRVGTPTSSLSWSLEDSTPSSSRSSSEDGKQQSSQPQRGRPMSLRVPVQRHRTQSLSPNPSCFSRVPVTPREVRSAADGGEIQDLHTGRFLPNIPPPPPTAASAGQRPESGRRREQGPSDENNSLREQTVGDHPGCRQVKSSNKMLLKKRDRTTKRSLPNISLIPQGNSISHPNKVKYQTLMLDDAKVERPSGVCCLGNGADGKGVVAVADCGRGRIVDVGFDGVVTGVTLVWEDDGDSVKAQGVFDVAQTDGGCIVVSDSQQKQVIMFDEGRRAHTLELPVHTDPRGVTSQGHRIFICDQGNHCVQMLDLHDKNDIKPKAKAIALSKANEQIMVCPYYASVDQAGDRILVSDYGAGALILARVDNAHPPLRVKLVASSATSHHGRPCTATNIEIRPTGVAWLPNGRGAVVADQIGHRLVVVDEELNVVGSFGRQGSRDGEFLFPHGITFVSDSLLGVCDMNNARIQFVKLELLLASIN